MSSAPMPTSDARHRSVIETSPDVVVVMDASGTIVSVNQAVKSVLGYDPEELVGRSITAIMPERFREQHMKGMRRYLATNERKFDWRSIQLAGLDKAGCEVPLSIAFGEFEENGQRLFTGILRDATAAKKAADFFEFLALATPTLNSAQLDYAGTLTALVELAVPRLADWCAVDVLSASGGIERLAVAHLDPAKVALAKELQARFPARPDAEFGVPSVLRSGRSEIAKAISDDLLERLVPDAEQLAIVRSLGLRSYAIVPLAAFGTVYGTLSLVSAESNRRFDEADLPLLEDLGQRAGVAIHNAGLYRDALATSRKLEEQAEELERQSEEAQALAEELASQTDDLVATARDLEKKSTEADIANRAKSEFLASMSHELRTPLNAIGGYVDLLQLGVRGPLSAEQSADLDRVKAATGHLTALIDDILNFAKLDSGKVDYQLEWIPLGDVVVEAESMIAPQIEKMGLRYESRFCDAPTHVRVDRGKLRQILLNLLTNALKFTAAAGSITLACEADDREVRISVSDTGVGIPADRFEEIFEPFFQMHRGLSRPADGVGLGLAISRSLARGMKGDITVASDVGVGATFTLRVPRTPAPGLS